MWAFDTDPDIATQLLEAVNDRLYTLFNICGCDKCDKLFVNMEVKTT